MRNGSKTKNRFPVEKIQWFSIAEPFGMRIWDHEEGPAKPLDTLLLIIGVGKNQEHRGKFEKQIGVSRRQEIPLSAPRESKFENFARGVPPKSTCQESGSKLKRKMTVRFRFINDAPFPVIRKNHWDHKRADFPTLAPVPVLCQLLPDKRS